MYSDTLEFGTNGGRRSGPYKPGGKRRKRGDTAERARTKAHGPIFGHTDAIVTIPGQKPYKLRAEVRVDFNKKG